MAFWHRKVKIIKIFKKNEKFFKKRLAKSTIGYIIEIVIKVFSIQFFGFGETSVNFYKFGLFFNAVSQQPELPETPAFFTRFFGKTFG